MHTTIVRGCLAAALLMGVAAPADAQGVLGRLGKKAGEAVAKRTVGEKVEEAAAEQAGQGSRPLKGRKVGFTDGVLEITDARLGQLVGGLEAERALGPSLEGEIGAQMARYQKALDAYPAQQAKYERDRDAFDAKRAAHDRCMDGLNARWEKEDEKNPDRARMEQIGSDLSEGPEADARERRLTELGERLQAAQARGDQKAMMAISDSVQKELAVFTAASREGMAVAERSTAQTEARKKEAAAKCPPPAGTRPEAPPSPDRLYPKGASERLAEAGAKKSGLAQREYDVLRERVGAWCVLRKRNPGTQYVFTSEELAALEGQAAKLEPYCEQLQR